MLASIGTAIIGAVLLLLVGGVVVSTYHAWRATVEMERADAERDAAAAVNAFLRQDVLAQVCQRLALSKTTQNLAQLLLVRGRTLVVERLHRWALGWSARLTAGERLAAVGRVALVLLVVTILGVLAAPAIIYVYAGG